jgi:hypothetical protein
MTSYEEILELTKELSASERLQLADALLSLEGPGNGRFSLEDFERDMALLAQGLENLPSEYQGNFPREDIYLDHN